MQTFHLKREGNIECNSIGANLLAATSLWSYPDMLVILSANETIDKVFLS